MFYEIHHYSSPAHTSSQQNKINREQKFLKQLTVAIVSRQVSQQKLLKLRNIVYQLCMRTDDSLWCCRVFLGDIIFIRRDLVANVLYNGQCRAWRSLNIVSVIILQWPKFVRCVQFYWTTDYFFRTKRCCSKTLEICLLLSVASMVRLCSIVWQLWLHMHNYSYKVTN